MTASRIYPGMKMAAAGAAASVHRRRWNAPIYPALRLDLTLAHVAAATVRLTARNPNRWEATIENGWRGDDAVAFLSVRSAFSAMLEALAWPARTEILVTGINIADMVRIVASFGHIAIPVDLDPATLAPDPAEIARNIGPATRGVVVAHLFGGHFDMTALMDVARRHDLLVIEDSAQAYTTRSELGNRRADVRLFSFGLLKTGTALGGAVAEVGDANLRQAMRNIQSAWRRQPRTAYAAKVAKAFLFLLLQRPVAYGLFSRLCTAAGSSSGAVLRKLTRGFASSDTPMLLHGLRQRPCAPLLAMLAWRLANEDGRRTARRAATGERMFARLSDLGDAGLVCLGYRQAWRSHWLVPVSVADPAALRRDLARGGFDAHGASNVVAIGGPRAKAMIDGLVFVPCYPEMDDATRGRVCEVVRAHCRSKPRAQSQS